MVSTSTSPSFSSFSWGAGGGGGGGEEDKGLGKRAMNDNRILPKLPNKRQQVPKEDVSQSQILAEAVPQPHQMQWFS